MPHMSHQGCIVSGMPPSFQLTHNICNLVIENCAPYDFTLERGNILGILEIEDKKLVPLTDDFISTICQDCFPKVKRKRLSREDIQKWCHLQTPEEYKEKYINILHKYLDALSVDKYDLDLAKDITPKIHLKQMIRSIENNSKFQRHTTNSSRKYGTYG